MYRYYVWAHFSCLEEQMPYRMLKSKGLLVTVMKSNDWLQKVDNRTSQDWNVGTLCLGSFLLFAWTIATQGVTIS